MQVWAVALVRVISAQLHAAANGLSVVVPSLVGLVISCLCPFL